MSTTFGVTAQGFVRKTLQDIVMELESDERSEIADNLDVSTESPAGQFNGIFGRQLAIAWEALEQCYHGFDPDAAEGRLLETIAKLTGTYRIGSTASEVRLVVNLNTGTTLLAGQHFAADEDRPDIRWTPKANYTAASDGLRTIDAVCEILGPVEGLAGKITVIATPVVGWNSVSNPEDAELGKDVDTDAALRARRERELANIGSTTVRAVTSAVSRAFASSLDNLFVNENDTDATVDSLPPHSIEVLIFDGEVPTIDNDELAQVIYDSKAAGIRAYGNVTGYATAIVNGQEAQKPVSFSRAEQVAIWVELDIGTQADYVGDDEVKRVVAEAANERFAPGRDIRESPIRSFPFDLTGVESVTAVRIGLAEHPAGSADIPISFRQIARFDTSRIKVTSTPVTY